MQSHLLGLQRTIGNRAVGQIIGSGALTRHAAVAYAPASFRRHPGGGGATPGAPQTAPERPPKLEGAGPDQDAAARDRSQGEIVHAPTAPAGDASARGPSGYAATAPGEPQPAHPAPAPLARSHQPGSRPRLTASPGFIQRGWFDTITDTVSDLAGSAVGAVSGVLDTVMDKVRAAFDAVIGRITAAWDAVNSGAAKAIDAAIREATGFLGAIGGLLGAVGSALRSLEVDPLRAAWGALTGAAGAALGAVRGVLTRVTATIDGLWSGLKNLANGLIGGLRSQAEGLIRRLPGPIQGTARALWSKFEATLTSAWRSIEAGWTSMRNAALKRVNQLVTTVADLVAGLKTSAIAKLIATLEQVKGLFATVKRLLADPDALIDPIVQEISGRLRGLPEKAKGETESRARAQSSSGPGATSAGPSAAPAAAPSTAAPRAAAIQRLIQRDAAPAGQPRATLGFGQVVSGSWDFITDKLSRLWANLGATIKEMVISVLDPRAIWKGLKDDWNNMTKELSTRAARIEGIRTDNWKGFWEDLRRFLSNLVDFPLIVWRTANAMLGRLSVYIGLALVLGGAVAGAIAAGTGGAVFGSVVPGAGTAAGGAAGVAAGAWAGAQAGYAAAEAVGLVMLASFAAAEQLTVVKSLNDLLWVPQTKAEQDEDFNQTTDSVIAIATALLLMAIAFIGVAIAKRVWAFVKTVPGRFRPNAPEPELGPPPPEVVPNSPDSIVICRCENVPGVPADLMARRARLTPEARARLDQTAASIFPDPANPTPKQFDNLRAFMDAVERKGGGDLEKGLQDLIAADARRKAPPPTPPAGPPFGPRAGDLPALRADVEATIAEIENFVKANPDKATITEAAKKLRSVADGPLKDMENGAAEVNDYLVERVQGQIRGSKGELESAKAAPPGTKFGEELGGREIDEIHPDGTLRQIKNYDLFEKTDQQFAKVMAQLEGTLKVAQQNPVNGQPRQVIMEFRKGVKADVATELRAATVNGQKATIVGQEFP